MHSRNAFVTLTYDQEHMPVDGSLDVREWQLFAKRVRKELGPFRFLHCGEYGERTYRPHYHALLFGLDFADRVLLREKRGGNLYASPTLERLWGRGQCSFGAVTPQSAAYVARYSVKAESGSRRKEQYRRLDEETGEEWYVRPEYLTMSRRPGLGAGWYAKFKSDVFPDDEVVLDGFKQGVPDFYWRKLEQDDPALFFTLKAARQEYAARDVVAAPLGVVRAEGSEQSFRRLGVRERVAHARLRDKVSEL